MQIQISQMERLDLISRPDVFRERVREIWFQYIQKSGVLESSFYEYVNLMSDNQLFHIDTMTKIVRLQGNRERDCC